MADVENAIDEADPVVKALARDNGRTELDAMLEEANRAVNKCIFDHAWVFSIPAALISVPFGMRYKTFSPLVFAAVTGSGLDYFRGVQKCQHHYDRIKQFRLAIAIHDYEHGKGIESIQHSSS